MRSVSFYFYVQGSVKLKELKITFTSSSQWQYGWFFPTSATDASSQLIRFPPLQLKNSFAGTVFYSVNRLFNVGGYKIHWLFEWFYALSLSFKTYLLLIFWYFGAFEMESLAVNTRYFWIFATSKWAKLTHLAVHVIYFSSENILISHQWVTMCSRVQKILN